MKEKELDYLVLDLEEWCSKGVRCSFCTTLYSDDDMAICQIRTRSKLTDEIVANDRACENCKNKLNELPKCDNCGRLKTKLGFDLRNGKYTCDCEEEEGEQEKELPVLPPERRQTAFYERQINGLREELTTAEIEAETHLEALEVSEVWHKNQKQELLDRIKELEAENRKLKEKTPQELLDEISKLKERVQQLEEQNGKLTAQIQVKEVKKQFS